jgi:hypothetical protein
MIFHGVYTTPQQIDSTLSTTSNNAVNGQAVADYVRTQLENVGGPVIDTTVQQNSNNAVSSGAVYTAIQAIPSGGITPEYRTDVLNHETFWSSVSTTMTILDKIIHITIYNI